MYCALIFNLLAINFLVYVKDQIKASDVLDPIMFADDTTCPNQNKKPF